MFLDAHRPWRTVKVTDRRTTRDCAQCLRDTGIGWGVVDRLNQLGCSISRGIDFGAKADRTDGMVRYANSATRCGAT